MKASVMKARVWKMWANGSCRRIEAQLWEYFAGNLSEPETQQMRRHLDRCSACRTLSESVMATVPLVAALREVTGPNSDTDFQDLLLRLDTRQRLTPRPTQTILIGTMGAVVGLVLFAMLLTRHTDLPPRSFVDLPHSKPMVNVTADRLQPLQTQEHLPKNEFDRSKFDGSDYYRSKLTRGNLGSIEPSKVDIANVAAIARPALRARLALSMQTSNHNQWRVAMNGKWGSRITSRFRNEQARPISQEDTARTLALDPMAKSLDTAQLPEGDPNPHTYVMPTVGQSGDRGVRRAFVMDGIPTTTLAGQAGAAAAEARNPEMGKAL